MPYGNPFREDRRRHMQELLTFIQNEGTLEIDFVLGWGGLKWGSTEIALTSMLNQLEKANVIEIDIEGGTIKSLLPKPQTPDKPGPGDQGKKDTATRSRQGTPEGKT
jgi:hypothetical protein